MSRHRLRTRYPLALCATATGAAVALTAAVALGGDDPTAPAAPSAPPPAAAALTPPQPVQADEPPLAVDVLATLPVRPVDNDPAYDRDAFDHWTDADGDSCDTRAEVLERDAQPGTVIRDEDGCVVGATIVDPYTGEPVTEKPGRASDVDIDHVISLSGAWRTGAADWTDQRREQYANDPTNLVATRDSVNRAKSDQSAATWLPPNPAARCGFVARQIAVKARYDLWVCPAERDAMAAVLTGCPGQRTPAAAS